VHITRAAHVIKGAAANLMCGELKETASMLEKVAQKASSDPNPSNPAILSEVQARYEALRTAVQNYNAHLESIGV